MHGHAHDEDGLSHDPYVHDAPGDALHDDCSRVVGYDCASLT